MQANDLSLSLATAVEAAAPSLVLVHGRRRGSSGILLAPDGAATTALVVTAAHTLHRGDGVVVTLADGRQLAAELLGVDPRTDVALLRLPEALPAAPVTPKGGQRVGEVVLSVGHTPFGLRAAFGIVAGVAGAWRTAGGGRVDRYINVDGSLPPGLSGGALVSAGGEVIGMNSSGLTRGGGTVPVATLARVAAQLLAHGGIREAFLGVGVQPAPLAGNPAAEGREAGLLVVSLTPDAPAAAGGLRVGDVVVGADGKPLAHPAELRALLHETEPDAVLSLSVLRGDAPLTLPITVGARVVRAEPGRGCR